VRHNAALIGTEGVRVEGAVRGETPERKIMQFVNRKGDNFEFDPFDQSSIDAAKAQAPGEGIGIAIGTELTNKIASGEVTRMSQLPHEYQQLGRACGLPE
jgi:hypothetical protein